MTFGQRLFRRLVDDARLRVAIGMIRAFLGLTVGMQAVSSASEQFAHDRATDLVPELANSTARTRKLLQVQRKGDIGSPRLSGSTSASRSLISVGSASVRGLRPPPSRRTRPFASRSGDAKSFSPRPIVERATPVARETAAIPPRPNAFASLAVWSRRSRSFKTSQSASWRTDINSLSIMPQAIPQAQNGESLRHPQFDALGDRSS